MPFTAASNAARWPKRDDAYWREYVRNHCDIDAKGCWIWRGKTRSYNGYVQASFGGVVWRVHRYSYTLFKGPIPEGLFVCHSCDTPDCCNPDHLWAGTREENMQDSKRKGRHYLSTKPTCVRGHLLAGDNLVKKGPGERACKICVRSLNRIKRGWPIDLAWNTPPVSPGRRVVNANWKRRTAAQGPGQ